MVDELKADLDDALGAKKSEPPKPNPAKIRLHNRMFEISRMNLQLFDLEPIVSFAEALIDGPCHVIHNNSFQTPPGGGITGWHQDDPPHMVVTHGEPPTNIRLPVLLFTANYYLTDVDRVENGPTQTVPGSHLSGKSPPNPFEGTEYENRVVSNLGPAGSVIMFNNQVWHRRMKATARVT
jgi:ectoine hydroxylase-related dioxygenase (phytanoyl-CoA dioxygenase family)